MKATWIKANGTWKQVKNVWQKVNGVWKKGVMPKGNVNGTWKELMSYGRYNIYYTEVLGRESYKISLPYRVVDPSYNITEDKTLTINTKNFIDGYAQLLGITHINPSEGIIALYITTNRSSDRNDLIIIANLITGTILKQWETQRMLGVQIKGWSLKSNGNVITLMYETFNERYTNLKVFDLNLNVIKDVLISRSNTIPNYLLRRDGGIYFIDKGSSSSKLVYMDSNYQLKKEIDLSTTTASLGGIDKYENVYILGVYDYLYKYSPELELLSENSTYTPNIDRFIDHEGKIVEESWSHSSIKRKNFDGSILWERSTSTAGGNFSLDTNGNYIRYNGGEVIGSSKGDKIKTLPNLNKYPLNIQGNFI